MDTETYPDVTLASNPAIEQRAPLNVPNQNESSGAKDTFVILKPKRQRYQISRNQIIIITFISLLVLVVAIIITAFVTKHVCETCSNCKTASSADTGSLTSDQSNSNPVQNGNRSGIAIPKKLPPEDSVNPDKDTNQPYSGIRLPRSVIPSLYEIRLKIDLTECTYHGAVNITLKINTTTKYIVLHKSVIDIDENSVRISSRYSPDRNIVRQLEVEERNFHVLELDRELEAGNTYILGIGHYSGELLTNLRGLYLSSYETKEGEVRRLAASQLQAMDARRVFPCFDEPDLKARFKMTIIYQKEYTALTNMPAMSTTVIDSEWIRKDFETTPVMSTYLLAVIVSDLKSRNYTYDNGYELRVWAKPEAYAQTEYALEFAVKTYDFFTDYFGMPDVVPKSDHVAVPDFSSGAMENWGLVVYRETSLLYDRLVSSSENKYTVTLIVAHEIAHTWFGNMVTMEWWDDLWLNEGFASLLMYIAMDYLYPQWNVFAIQVVDDIFPVMVEDALSTSHPVSSIIADPEDIPQHFDSISYSKGMAVLRMMMEFAGSEKFRNALRLYVERYRFKNANMAQLWKTFTESLNSSYDVAQIMDTWTRQMGYPVVIVEDHGAQFMLHQERFLLDRTQAKKQEKENPFGYKWYIPFTYVTQEAPTDRKTVWLNLVSASIPKPTNGWLLGNYEFSGFFRVMYEKKMWAMLADQLMRNHTVFPEANRAGLIGDAFALARANLLDYDVALNLTRYLKKEQSYIPWRAFLHSIEFLRAMIANKAAYVQLQHYIRELVAPVFDLVGASDKGELPERYLRRIILSMACDIGMEKAVSYAKSMFANWMKHDNRLPPDLSKLIYSVGIREGDDLEWDYVWDKARSTKVASEVEMMLESLVSTQKSWLLWRYINWLFDAEKIRPQNVRYVISYFSKTPLSRIIALQFVLNRWDDLVDQFAYDPFLLRDVIQKVTLFVNTEYDLKQLENLFKKNTPRGATYAVDNALALIRTNLACIDANYDKITKWLDDNNA